MLVTTEYITPTELTGYARAELADLQVNRFTLDRWLPNREIDDLVYRFVKGGGGLVDAATYRGYDTESPISGRRGVTRTTGELPPISRKMPMGEYDRLRQRRLDAEIRNQVLNDTRQLVREIAARVELARGEALYSGQLVIEENGIVATVDFGRAAGHTVAPATLWTNAAAVPVSDLMTWADVYEATTGDRPGAILTSRRVVSLLMRNEEVRNLAFPTGGNQPQILGEPTVNSVLQSFGLPSITIYGAQVRVNGASQQVIPDDRVILLPGPGGDNQLGATLYGTTAESMEEEFSLEGEQPGVVAGSYSTKDPVTMWTKAAAIALPVLANPDLSLAADVA